MKISEFNKIIKNAVKEAIQEELKEILLEAIRTPKTIISESKNHYAQPIVENPKQLSPSERKAIFGNIIEEMQNGKTATTEKIEFNVSGPVDTVNGYLPEGEVGLEQIMGLMKK